MRRVIPGIYIVQEALALGCEIAGEDKGMYGVKRKGTKDRPYIEVVRVRTLHTIFHAVVTGEEIR